KAPPSKNTRKSFHSSGVSRRIVNGASDIGSELVLGHESWLGVAYVGVVPIESFDQNILDGHLVDTSRVDTVAVRVRTWDIERLDATDATEQMFRDACIESIGRQKLGTLNQSETRLRHD